MNNTYVHCYGIKLLNLSLAMAVLRFTSEDKAFLYLSPFWYQDSPIIFLCNITWEAKFLDFGWTAPLCYIQWLEKFLLLVTQGVYQSEVSEFLGFSRFSLTYILWHTMAQDLSKVEFPCITPIYLMAGRAVDQHCTTLLYHLKKRTVHPTWKHTPCNVYRMVS